MLREMIKRLTDEEVDMLFSNVNLIVCMKDGTSGTYEKGMLRVGGGLIDIDITQVGKLMLEPAEPEPAEPRLKRF